MNKIAVDKEFRIIAYYYDNLKEALNYGFKKMYYVNINIPFVNSKTKLYIYSKDSNNDSFYLLDNIPNFKGIVLINVKYLSKILDYFLEIEYQEGD